MTRRPDQFGAGAVALSLLFWPPAAVPQDVSGTGSQPAAASGQSTGPDRTQELPPRGGRAAPATVTVLKDDPEQYIGTTVVLAGEVDDVLGPRLFTVDERNWLDLEGELLVFAPAAPATAVREADHIAITSHRDYRSRAALRNDRSPRGVGLAEAGSGPRT